MADCPPQPPNAAGPTGAISSPAPIPPAHRRPQALRVLDFMASSAGREILWAWTWFLAKNILGWVLILASFVIGPLVPGPGGIPIFLIGFALVTLPGKRKLTARVLRGRRMGMRTRASGIVATAMAVVLAAVSLELAGMQWGAVRELYRRGPAVVIGLFVAGVGIWWVLVQLGARGLNVVIRGLPRVRRVVRPWLRRWHIRLLPPRRRRRLPHEKGDGPHVINDEILAFGKGARGKDR